MAQTMHLASFGPVFVVSAFPNPPKLKTKSTYICKLVIKYKRMKKNYE